MRSERQAGATFSLGNVGWIDFETRSLVPITSGTSRYSRHAQAIIIAWAIGDGEVHTDAVVDFSQTLSLPAGLRPFIDRVLRGEAVLCAHNAGFDRAIWNSIRGWPYMHPRHFIDTRVQASVNGLPADLDHAAKYAAGISKDKAGKGLIKLFCTPDAAATPISHQAEWQQFIAYARQDIVAMRELFLHTRQLPMAEWREYWVSEEISERGMPIDVDLAEAAAKMAAADRLLANRELLALTDGAVRTVDSVKPMKAWLNDLLPEDGRKILVARMTPSGEVDEDGNPVLDEEGNPIMAAEHTLRRPQVVRLIAYLEAREVLDERLQAVLRLLQIRLYGGSKTPAKFSKMLASQVDGIISHQYTFSGAAQTGRFSARGIQVHNLMRTACDYEIEAIDALVGGTTPDEFAMFGDTTPISRKLSLLIRPTIVARKGSAFVWSDWANIEARILPWIAMNPQADARLDVFRAVDRKQEEYDIYTRTAAELSGLQLHEVDEKVRQRGKVVELACGYGGGRGALLNMAAGYGMHLSDDEADAAVRRWRQANPWALQLWGKDNDTDGSYGLWGAACRAMRSPRQFMPHGLAGYIFLPGYLTARRDAGSLLCRLPSGRWLTYRNCRWQLNELHEDEYHPDRITGVKRELMFSRDNYSMKMWHGLLVENIVQAVAADILRGTLVRLAEHESNDWMPVRLHTHDEVLVEVTERRVAEAGAVLWREMVRGFEWSDGLPLAADIVTARWYSKSKKSWGL